VIGAGIKLPLAAYDEAAAFYLAGRDDVRYQE
jgi:hypothetical protein